MPPRKAPTTITVFLILLCLAFYSLLLSRSAIFSFPSDLRFRPQNLIARYKDSDSFNHVIREDMNDLTRRTRLVTSIHDPVDSFSVLLPNWEVLVLVYNEIPLTLNHADGDLYCFFLRNETSPTNFSGMLSFGATATFKCILPNRNRILQPFQQPVQARFPAKEPNATSASSMMPRWNQKSPEKFNCVFGDNIKNAVRIVVTSSKQEVFRCHHPTIAAAERIKVSIEIRSEKLVVPSVAYYTTPPRRTPSNSKPKSLLCATTMVYNVAKFLREWVIVKTLSVKCLRLEGFLDDSMVVIAKLSLNDASEQVVNPAYLRYVKQDSSLASWLLSTVSTNILPQLVGVESTAVVWNAITRLYSTLSTTKIMALHCRLRSMKKGSQSMRDYTMSSMSQQWLQLLRAENHLLSTMWFNQNFKGVTAQQSSSSKVMQANMCSCFPHAIDCHYSHFINTNAADEETADTKPYDNAQVNALMANGPLSHVKWFPDSGATHHVTGTTSALSSKQAYTGSGKVHLGDGSTISIAHVGTNILKTDYRDLLLDHILHVPNINKNLLHNNTVVKSANEYWLWHKRLGHPATKVVMTILNKRLSVDKCEVCAACQMSKCKIQPFSMSQTVYKQFELVEVDVWGLSPIVTSGFRYFVSFVDLYSRNNWVYLLKNKSEVVVSFEIFVALVSNQFKTTILALQTDNGGEFRFLEAITRKLGTQLRKSFPHTSQQNGVVERKHRHIVETSLTLLAQASMPLTFWSHAVLSAVYLINKMPSKSLGNISPYQKLYEKVPDYNFLKIFGCQCFPNLRVFNTHKLDFRSKACVFLGYSPIHHGYQCMDEHGRIYVSRSVLFNEHIFPFAHKAVAHKKDSDESIRSRVVPVVSSPHKQTRLVPRSDTNTDISTGQEVEASSASPTAATGNELYIHFGEHSANTKPDSTAHESSVDVFSQQEQSASSQQEQYVSAKQDQSVSTEQVQSSGTILATRVSNTHSMVTRSKHEIFKPKIYSVQCKAVPSDIRVALKDDDWRMAVKKNADGSVERLKARLVAKGQVDVNNAFLKDDLSEDVYMQQVPGFEEQSSDGTVLVCKLKKALYGLRQAPRNWFLKLRDFLLSLRFKSSRAYSSLFVRQEDHEVVYMVVYVDDILITEVHRSDNGLFFSQKKFITELLHKNQMSSVNSASTKNDGEVLHKPQQYRSVVEALQYICHTRPYISFAVNKAAQFLQEPTEVHWLAIKLILRYLRGTLETGLWFPAQAQKLVTLNAFSDFDWGGDADDRGQSLVTVCITGTTCWHRARKNNAQCPGPLQKLNTGVSRMPLLKFAVAMAVNPILHAKSKHIEFDLHFVREKVAAHEVQINYLTIMYYSVISIDKFILYDNGNNDNIEVVIMIKELKEEGDYNIERIFWVWPKTKEVGFSHGAIYFKDSCSWTMYVDVDEFIFSPPWLKNSSRPSKTMLKSLLSTPSDRSTGQVSIKCNDFRPSDQKNPPKKGGNTGIQL
ncbi:hypothetical protein F3Y22_tig00110895pilonHSYRG00027 [Hibiscus syriacus]|uniref:Integrase catalytic domain-containing protein n=1 Tax=Hibiscus syriacus TaxID=106335 RepID=A0A6A2ZG51_HIBSY|nr:hypothetical protein F3Y22_tig00110895pilonHSYRG00027 [Hibiscus syriacus]